MNITYFSTLVVIAASAIALPAIARAEPAPCADGQVQVTNGGEHARTGHRAVVLSFRLAAGAQACTLTGYPGVDSGAGGPLLHAERTLSGFMGGLDTDRMPTLTVSEYQPATALVEGVAVDRLDAGHLCPTYRQLVVTPPDATVATAVPVGIDTCELQVHPMGTSW
jgi:hypothetical protein